MAFLLACVLCGALVVPLHPVNTPIAGVIGGLMAAIGLVAQRWARLADARLSAPSAGVVAAARSAIGWFLAGLALGLVLLGVIRLVIEPIVPAAGARIAAAGDLPVWRRVVIIYVAAVGEELLFRVLLLSLVTGGIVQLTRWLGTARPASSARGAPSAAVLWTATGVAALGFAAVHLQAWSSIGALTLGTAAMVMALNSAGGLLFGYAFVTRGILAAVAAHAGADCAIQLIGPLTR